jgi:hypothetical protein
MTEYGKQYRRDHVVESRIRDRKKHIRRKYGLTAEAFDGMVMEQCGRCYICGEHDNLGLMVDHNHVTGNTRRLLCFNCNLMLGYSGDSPALLKRAIAYLEQFDPPKNN